MSDEKHYEHIDETPFTKLGDERESHQPRNTFEIDLEEWLGSAIDPKQYFITTGEAIRKAEVLEKELWARAGKARKFLQALKKCRGENTYLETEWKEGRLLVKIKNPRNKK